MIAKDLGRGGQDSGAELGRFWDLVVSESDGWPVEAAVIWFLDGRALWWEVFAIALPATAAIAFLSWHLIERPALRLKPGGRRQVPLPSTAAPQHA